jgi:hypothetical protein
VGKSLSTILSAGRHVITLSALDNEGKTARTTVSISMNPPLVITNVRLDPINGFASFDWLPVPGASYAVERASQLTDAEGWTTIGTNLTSGTFTDSTPPPDPHRYYRLRME